MCSLSEIATHHSPLPSVNRLFLPPPPPPLLLAFLPPQTSPSTPAAAATHLPRPTPPPFGEECGLPDSQSQSPRIHRSPFVRPSRS